MDPKTLSAFTIIIVLLQYNEVHAQFAPQYLMNYADSLYNAGDYYRAHYEYDKIRYFTPEYARQNEILLRMIDCCLRIGALEQASKEIKLFELQTANSIESVTLCKAKLYYMLGYYYESMNQISGFDETESDVESKLSYMMLAYCSNMRLGNIIKSQEIGMQLDSIISGEKVLFDIEPPNHFGKLPRYKKPLIAGIFGIVPGGGYLYTGKIQTAIGTAIITSILGYFAYDGLQHDDKFKAISLSFLTLTVEVGSIYGGMRQVYLQNNNLLDKQLEDIEVFLGVNFD